MITTEKQYTLAVGQVMAMANESVKGMTLEQITERRQERQTLINRILAYEQKRTLALYRVMLMKTGYGGLNEKSEIVDRRIFPDAVPLKANPIYGVPEPLPL